MVWLANGKKITWLWSYRLNFKKNQLENKPKTHSKILYIPETGPKLLLSLKRFPAILSKSRNTLRALGVSRSSASASSNSETRDTNNEAFYVHTHIPFGRN